MNFKDNDIIDYSFNNNAVQLDSEAYTIELTRKELENILVELENREG